MTTTDTDALKERIARVLYSNDFPTHMGGWDHARALAKERYADRADAVLPIVAAEVRKAKAEALRELSAHISKVVDNAKPWQVFTEHVLHEAGACDYLDRAATEYETGDQR